MSLNQGVQTAGTVQTVPWSHITGGCMGQNKGKVLPRVTGVVLDQLVCFAVLACLAVGSATLRWGGKKNQLQVPPHQPMVQ